jgi:diketogulonate reductase-like aldo/keto reductase
LSTATIPTLTLNNGVEMPAFGFGVFQSPPEETTSAVEAAIANGYPLVDTAAAYGNEREVGEAIRRSGVDRGQIFIVTKLWISDYGYDEALVGFDGCLRRLGVDYVDLVLLHQPVPTEFDRTVGAYKAIGEMLAAGRTRAIGVANFMEDHLGNLLGQVDVVPAVNQIEVHPYFSQPELRGAMAERGIATQAWSPIGGVYAYGPKEHLRPRGHCRRRAGGEVRQDACAGRPALAHRARVLRDPEVGQAAPHRGEHRHLRLPADL